MGLLTIPEHRHAIEYYRHYDRDHREHVHTETIDDQGFVLVHDTAKREDWLVRYTRTCAEEYFARSRSRAGHWIVHVYRLNDDERQHLISVRLHWPGPGHSTS